MLFRFLAEAAFVVPCEQHFCPPCLFGKEFKNIVQGNDSLLRSKERLAYSFKGTISQCLRTPPDLDFVLLSRRTCNVNEICFVSRLTDTKKSSKAIRKRHRSGSHVPLQPLPNKDPTKIQRTGPMKERSRKAMEIRGKYWHLWKYMETHAEFYRNLFEHISQHGSHVPHHHKHGSHVT